MVKFSSGGLGFLGRAPRATPEQMRVRKQDQAAARAAQLRKQQTRQKIVLGGVLWQLAKDGNDPEAARVLDRILKGLTRDVDRKRAVPRGSPGSLSAPGIPPSGRAGSILARPAPRGIR